MSPQILSTGVQQDALREALSFGTQALRVCVVGLRVTVEARKLGHHNIPDARIRVDYVIRIPSTNHLRLLFQLSGSHCISLRRDCRHQAEGVRYDTVKKLSRAI